MRFVVRKDLGGYAAALPAIEALAEIEIVKPFVLLCGPNGAGKSAVLRMLRASMGLRGEREGHATMGQFSRHVDPGASGDDLGKLATYTQRGTTLEPESKLAGVIDIKAMGWCGQRTWLFDSRAESNLVAATSFDGDSTAYHLNLISGGASRVSHGQVLRHAWTEALRWSTATSEDPDPYDDPQNLSPARHALWEAVTAEGGGRRSNERWLLLDEPEAALDVEMQLTGFSLLTKSASLGHLRVFCASHSPLFAAGLADDPNVQVVDLGGRKLWFEVQKRALKLAAEPKSISAFATELELRFRLLAAEERKEKSKAAAKRISDAIHCLAPNIRAALVAALEHPTHELPTLLPAGKKLTSATTYSLSERKLVRETGTIRLPRAQLTELGVAAALKLSAKKELDPEIADGHASASGPRP